jgi:hypothetical protein
LFTSRVKIDDDRPYLTLFAAATACSNGRRGSVPSSGRRSPLRDPHLRIDVEQPLAGSRTVALDALASGQQLRPLVAADACTNGSSRPPPR